MTDHLLAYLAGALATTLYLHGRVGWAWLPSCVASTGWPLAVGASLWLVAACAILCSLEWFLVPRKPEE